MTKVLRPAALSVDGSPLERTLAGALKDRQMVTPEGKSFASSIEGVSIRDLTTHTDGRGTVTELYDPRWQWHPDPLVFAYCFTVRPGYAKGWNLHKLHDDRYCLLQGEMELVLYDVRPELFDLRPCQPHRAVRAPPATGQCSQICLARRRQYRSAGLCRHKLSDEPIRSRRSR